MANNEALLEKLAKLEHEQWQAWARVRDPKHPLINIPYELLTEPQKEQDRFWARKVLTIIADQQVSPFTTPEQLQHLQEGKDNTTDRSLCEFYDELQHVCAEDGACICPDPRVPFCLTRLEAKNRKYKLKKEAETIETSEG